MVPWYDNDATFGKRDVFSVIDAPHVLLSLESYEGSDDLASACRRWLSDLQAHSHAIVSYHCCTVISHLKVPQFDMPLSVLL